MIKLFKEVNDHWSFFDRLKSLETLIYDNNNISYYLFIFDNLY